jgi:hypothetical protein
MNKEHLDGCIDSLAGSDDFEIDCSLSSIIVDIDASRHQAAKLYPRRCRSSALVLRRKFRAILAADYTYRIQRANNPTYKTTL